MKMQIYIHLATLIFLSGPVFSQRKHNMDKQDTTIHIAARPAGQSVWGEINAGYSNDGVMGSLVMNYRKGNIFFGTSYYKSHICYDDNKKRDYFLNTDNSQNHKTVESIAIFSGIILPGKCAPSFSVGISWTKFTYITTIPVDENVTLTRIWETIIGSDYSNEVLGSRTIQTIGIPVSFSIHISPKHFAGMDATLHTNLNMHRVLISAALGIHLGRILSTRPVISNSAVN